MQWTPCTGDVAIMTWQGVSFNACSRLLYSHVPHPLHRAGVYGQGRIDLLEVAGRGHATPGTAGTEGEMLMVTKNILCGFLRLKMTHH